MSTFNQLGLRFSVATLLTAVPLVFIASGCGGGDGSTPFPTATPTGTTATTATASATGTTTATPTSNPTATQTPRATATPVGTTALNFSGTGSGINLGGSEQNQGWRFTTKQALAVNALGFYDNDKDGLKASHKVGIFDVTTKALLASTTVSPGDPLSGFFRFHYLSAPVTLIAGRDYYIVATMGSVDDAFVLQVSSLSVNTAITFDGSASSTTNDANTLAYPDGFLNDNKGNFGPTFRFR